MKEVKPISIGDLTTQTVPYIDNANNAQVQANRAIIDTDDRYNTAADFLKLIQTNLKLLEVSRKKLVQPLNDHVAYINDQYKPIKAGFEAAKRIMKEKATVWARSEEKRQRVEAAAAQKKADDEALRKAEEAEASGDNKGAEALIEVAAATPLEVVKGPTTTGKLTGASAGLKDNWVAEVTDPVKLCAAIGNGVLPVSLVEFKKGELRKYAGQLKIEFNDHGLVIKNDKGVVVR